MRYGFVTFNRPEDAYTAIDSSSGDSSLSTYDVSFGGRRAFCKTQYADLGTFSWFSALHNTEFFNNFFCTDGIHNYINYHDIGYPIEPYTPAPIAQEYEEPESFEDMLKKLKQSISARKPTREFNA